MRCLWSRTDKTSPQKLEFINLDDLEVGSPPEKMARTERSTMPRKIIIRSAKNLLNGSHSQQLSETSTAEPSGTAGVIKKMKEKSKKTPEDTPQNINVKYRPVVHFGFDDSLSSKLPPG